MTRFYPLTPVFAFAFTCLAAAPVLAEEVNVVEANGHFDKEVISLHNGQSLAAINNDGTDHNLHLLDEEGESTDIGVQHPGTKVVVKFPSEGTYKLRCSLKPEMRLVINVSN